jgi:hypothetical protein
MFKNLVRLIDLFDYLFVCLFICGVFNYAVCIPFIYLICGEFNCALSSIEWLGG